MANLVKYGEYTLEAAQDEQKQIEESGSGGDFMTLDEGNNVVRFLPPKVGVKSPFHVVDQHYIKVPGAVSELKFTCLRKTYRKPCPACAKADALKNSGNPVDADAARDYWPRRRVYANVIDRAEPEKGPRILGMPKSVHEALVAIRQDATAGGDFCNPAKGFDIVIHRKGTTKMDTEYSVRGAREASKLCADEVQVAEWIEAQHDLTTLVKVHTEQEIRDILNGKGASSQQPQEGRSRGPRVRTIQDDAIDTEGEEVS